MIDNLKTYVSINTFGNFVTNFENGNSDARDS